MDLSLSSSQEKKLEDGLAIAVGIGAWEFQSTNKFDSGVPILSQQRFADAISNTFGSGVASKLFPKVSLRSPGMSISPANAINTTMATGIGLLILDKVAKEFFKAEYDKADGLGPAIRGFGKGLTVGGIVGGFFDPIGATTTVRLAGAPYGPVAPGPALTGLPYAGGAVTATPVVAALNR